MVRTFFDDDLFGCRHIVRRKPIAAVVIIGVAIFQQSVKIIIIRPNRGDGAFIGTTGKVHFRTGGDVQAISHAFNARGRVHNTQETAGLDLHAGAIFAENIAAAYQVQLACPGDPYGTFSRNSTSKGMPVCIKGHGHIRYKRARVILIFREVITSVQYRRTHPVYLIQQGNAGRQVHLPLFIAGQLLIQGVNLTELRLDLLHIVRRNPGGQPADQIFDGADRTGERARRAGIPFGIAAGVVVLMQAGQHPGDAAAVPSAHMRT